MSSGEAWQQEKEFLDYMFISLHGGGSSGNGEQDNGADASAGRTRRSAQQLPSPAATTSTTVSTKSPVKTEAPAGLDHLDNLCKLMEQLGELRDANSRLQKRVQYLEDMKTLQEMHQELDLFVGSDQAASGASAIDKTQDAGADRSLDSLDSGEILQPIDLIRSSNDPTVKSSHTNSNEAIAGRSSSGKKPKSGHHHMKFKKPALLKYRERSKSVGFDENIPIGDGQMDFTNAGSTTTTPSPENYNKMSDGSRQPSEVVAISRRGGRSPAASGTGIRTKTKVSKWTRVKEAFRWEKAHVDTSAVSKTSSVPPTAAKHPDKEVEPLSQRNLEVASTQTLSPDSGSHATTMAKSPSPVFRLGRRRRSTASRTSSTSSSSLSECPLESEILKSFADAQELPLFRLEKRASSPEVKLANPMRDEETAAAADLQRGSLLSLPQMKRLHRQSTVSCDGNFATCSPTVTIAHMPERIPEGAAISPDIPAADSTSAATDPFLSRIKGPESPNRRKISKNSSGHSLLAAEHELITAAENDESGSFISNLRSQLKPINEWTCKWHCDIMKNTTASSTSATHGDTSSRNSLSVPSTPNQHQAFTFDEFPETAVVDHQGQSRENSPGSKKNVQQDSPMESGPLLTSAGYTSTAIRNNPGLLLNTISPEFRKKVEVWERLKSGLSTNSSDQVFAITPPTPTTPNLYGKKPIESPDWNDIGKRRSEPDKLPPAFKKKLAEWEIRKAVAGKSDQNVEELHKILPHDFNRKLQEWERMKQQQAAVGKVSVVGNQPVLERQGSGKHHQRGKHVKATHKTEEGQQRGEKQKEKDLQWLEKELQKIEREKLRLEREREKYIERESRLEKIREAMKQPGHGPQREICIRTSTGEFRFQGLSRKFTKKLFQWEEQKGIRPEASTIALLDGAFNPNRSGHHHHLHHHHPAPGEFSSGIATRPSSLSAMTRSKSESSVADLVSASVHSQPSSLSLNDAETATEFDRRLNDDEAAQITPGPGALLVEVEDVTEESTAIVDIPEVPQPQAPIYSIAPAELRQTIHRSEQEDQPRYQIGITSPATIQRNDSIRTEASFKLLEENLSLLDRLRAKGEIVKYLELQMTSIDGDMAGVVNTQTEEMVRLKEEETCLSDQEENAGTGNSSTIDRLKKRIVLLENRGQQLKSEKEHLHAVYQRQCTQQANLVQHLVDKMQQLRDIGSSVRAPIPPFDPEALERLDTLTNEILYEAQSLENSIRQPHKLASLGRGSEVEAQKSSALSFPEKLSIKANQLKEEYERLRSFDSDGEENSDNETTVSTATLLPELPPVPSEMSAAAQKKVFVETHRLVFTPLERNAEVATQAEEASSGSDAPWRKNRSQKDQSSTEVPWRKSSLTISATDETPPDPSRPTATTVRNTAPNIRRMIDKYHQKVTGSTKDRSATPVTQFRSKCDYMIEERSSSPTPPPSIVIESKNPTVTTSDTMDTPLQCQQEGQLFPIQLSKSLSTGTMSESKGNQRSEASSGANWSRDGVLRSKSGLQIPTNQGVTCVRNPSFFRKSPLDPSIDDLLQKYRGRRQVELPTELPKSPTSNPERMLKLKQAREAFLTIGPGAIRDRDHDKVTQSEIDRMDLMEECIQNDDLQQPPSTPTSLGPVLVLQDIAFDACAEDSGSCRSQEGSTKSSIWPGSVPSSPAAHRRTKPSNRRPDGGNLPSPLGRHSWLKQPTKFFFPKPKAP